MSTYRGVVHAWLEVDHTVQTVSDGLLNRVDHLLELKLNDDKVVLSAHLTRSPPRRKRAGFRAWFEFNVFGVLNIGFDVARPGANNVTVQPDRPWESTDDDDLVSAVYEVQEALERLDAMLSRKPEDVDVPRPMINPWPLSATPNPWLSR